MTQRTIAPHVNTRPCAQNLSVISASRCRTLSRAQLVAPLRPWYPQVSSHAVQYQLLCSCTLTTHHARTWQQQLQQQHNVTTHPLTTLDPPLPPLPGVNHTNMPPNTHRYCSCRCCAPSNILIR